MFWFIKNQQINPSPRREMIAQGSIYDRCAIIKPQNPANYYKCLYRLKINKSM